MRKKVLYKTIPDGLLDIIITYIFCLKLGFMEVWVFCNNPSDVSFCISAQDNQTPSSRVKF